MADAISLTATSDCSVQGNVVRGGFTNGVNITDAGSSANAVAGNDIRGTAVGITDSGTGTMMSFDGSTPANPGQNIVLP